MNNHYSPKQLKLAVTRSIAIDPALSEKITAIVGFEPRWSKMSVEQLYAVQIAWEVLTNHTEREDNND